MQVVAHRKQGAAQPTLVITISDKDRKRRSSRAAGLISQNKESGATVLWFRAAPDGQSHNLYDWSRYILSRKSASNSESPVSPVFTSPFATKSRDMPEYFPRPGSANQNGRPLQHKSSTATYSTGRDRPVTFSSESPSLRSKRSDLSSPSSTNPHGIPGQLYTTVLPTDIGPSVGPSGEYAGDFTDGRSSAQGRSAVNSPTHRRESESTQGYGHDVTDVNAPPAPGETILDRAFKLGHIPFREPRIPGQEKLSSIARFDALMRDAEERRKEQELRQQREQRQRSQNAGTRSTFEADDSSDEAESQITETSESEDDIAPRGIDPSLQTTLISPTAQRALAFIAGRHGQDQRRATHRPAVSRNHLSFHADAMDTSPAPPARPHTAHAKSRPEAQRTQSTPHLLPTPTALDLPVMPGKPADEGGRRTNTDKRASTSSTKRLSFNEITKRLSSTSSLLLVQTNASATSSRGSSEVDLHSTSIPRTNLTLRGSGLPRQRDKDEQKCGWRGSVGVVSPDGGFL